MTEMRVLPFGSCPTAWGWMRAGRPAVKACFPAPLSRTALFGIGCSTARERGTCWRKVSRFGRSGLLLGLLRPTNRDGAIAGLDAVAQDGMASAIPSASMTGELDDEDTQALARVQRMVGGPARPMLQALAQLRDFLSRCAPATDVAASADPRRPDRRVRAGQCPLAGCEAVSKPARPIDDRAATPEADCLRSASPSCI